MGKNKLQTKPKTNDLKTKPHSSQLKSAQSSKVNSKIAAATEKLNAQLQVPDKKRKPKSTFNDVGINEGQIESNKVKSKKSQQEVETLFTNSEFISSKEEAVNQEITINAPKKKNTAEQDGPQLSIAAILQGALFVAGKDGMTLIELHKILPKSSTEEIRRHLLIMQDKYEKDSDMGLTLKEFGGRYKLLTKLQIKKEMQRFANLKFRNPLNSKLMEVLAIIAYNQPCTRPRISEIRGTDSAPLVDILMEKGLVVELGRADTWGRPFIYEVSEKFFDLFGINDIKELPEVQNFDVESFSDGSFFDTNRYEDN